MKQRKITTRHWHTRITPSGNTVPVKQHDMHYWAVKKAMIEGYKRDHPQASATEVAKIARAITPKRIFDIEKGLSKLPFGVRDPTLIAENERKAKWNAYIDETKRMVEQRRNRDPTYGAPARAGTYPKVGDHVIIRKYGRIISTYSEIQRHVSPNKFEVTYKRNRDGEIVNEILDENQLEVIPEKGSVLVEDLPDSRFPSDQLKKGTKVEMEHTTDHAIAKKIAKDHLAEDSEYYKKLEIMEKGGKLLDQLEAGLIEPEHLTEQQRFAVTQEQDRRAFETSKHIRTKKSYEQAEKEGKVW
jgi:hypothetical protein